MNYVWAFIVGGLICVIVQILMDNTKLLPLLGFGNVFFRCMKEAIDQEGFIGLFKGGFTACSVGVSGAMIFGYIGSLIFKPKMK